MCTRLCRSPVAAVVELPGEEDRSLCRRMGQRFPGLRQGQRKQTQRAGASLARKLSRRRLGASLDTPRDMNTTTLNRWPRYSKTCQYICSRRSYSHSFRRTMTTIVAAFSPQLQLQMVQELYVLVVFRCRRQQALFVFSWRKVRLRFDCTCMS